MKRKSILICILITTVILFVFSYKIYEEFTCDGTYLNYKSSCFDCEKQAIQQYGPDGAWLANPTKMFSAETSGVEQTGDISGGFLAKTI